MQGNHTVTETRWKLQPLEEIKGIKKIKPLSFRGLKKTLRK